MATFGSLLLKLALFAFGTAAYSALGLLSQLSKVDGEYTYSLSTVVLLAELCKLALSLSFRAQELSNEHSTSLGQAAGMVWNELVNLPRALYFWMAAPAVVYGINNMLDMFNNKFMDPATEQVLVQGKIITTAFAWRIVFGRALSWRQYAALALLTTGSVVSSLGKLASSPDRSGMHLEPIGVALVLTYCTLSAIAAITTEYIYKVVAVNHAPQAPPSARGRSRQRSASARPQSPQKRSSTPRRAARSPSKRASKKTPAEPRQHSVHILNAAMYIPGALALYLFAVADAPVPWLELPAGRWLVRGWNGTTVVLMFVYCAFGLCMSAILKHFDNIVKLLMSGTSMYSSALFSWLLFGMHPTLPHLFGMSLVFGALMLYNWELVSRFLFGDPAASKRKKRA